eukprot:4073158-Lingulodinium_polyedra.AAC.1
MVGVPAIISDLDAHPELNSHRGNGGMRRLLVKNKFLRSNLRRGFRTNARRHARTYACTRALIALLVKGFGRTQM